MEIIRNKRKFYIYMFFLKKNQHWSITKKNIFLILFHNSFFRLLINYMFHSKIEGYPLCHGITKDNVRDYYWIIFATHLAVHYRLGEKNRAALVGRDLASWSSTRPCDITLSPQQRSSEKLYTGGWLSLGNSRARHSLGKWVWPCCSFLYRKFTK